MEPLTFAIAALAGFFMGFVGSTVGGGGLISIPVLIFLGLSPHSAIATSSFAAIALFASSSYKYAKEKRVIWKYVPPLFAIYLVFAFVGSSTMLTVDEGLLSQAIGFILLALLVLFLFKPETGVKSTKPKHVWLGYFLMCGVAFWSGFFGAGYGIMAGYVLMLFFGMKYLDMAGTDMTAGWGRLVSSIAVFALAGVINFELGLAMGVGSFVGGYAGPHFAIKKGDAWMRLVFIAFVAISAIKLLLFP